MINDDAIIEQEIVDYEFKISIIAYALKSISPCSYNELICKLFDDLPSELFAKYFAEYRELEFVVLFDILGVLVYNEGIISFKAGYIEFIKENYYEDFNQEQIELLESIK